MAKWNIHFFLKGIRWGLHWVITFNLDFFLVFFFFLIFKFKISWKRAWLWWEAPSMGTAEGISRVRGNKKKPKSQTKQNFQLLCASIHLFLSQKEAGFAFPLLWGFQDPSQHLEFPKVLQGRTDLAAAKLQTSRGTRGMNWFLLLRVLLAGLAAFFWMSRQQEKCFFPFFFFWIMSVSFLLTLL